MRVGCLFDQACVSDGRRQHRFQAGFRNLAAHEHMVTPRVVQQLKSQTVRSRSCVASALRLRRREALVGVVVAGCLASLPDEAKALPRGGVDARVAKAFNNAFTAGGDPVAADKAWTDAISLDSSNSSAWSNRGTSRLQFGRWEDARSDLLKALELETAKGEKPSGLLLNQLGNADGAVGEWELACSHFRQAAELAPEIETIALANLALAHSQRGNDKEAIRVARSILRKDREFLDMRCALAAFLWASGEVSQAESEWSQLQAAQDGLGGSLYTKMGAVDRVKTRWPPRPTAALDAFLGVSRTGISQGYDGKVLQFEF